MVQRVIFECYEQYKTKGRLFFEHFNEFEISNSNAKCQYQTQYKYSVIFSMSFLYNYKVVGFLGGYF
jgi:hypothetical protein